MNKIALLFTAFTCASIASAAPTVLPKDYVFHAILLTDVLLPSESKQVVEFGVDQDAELEGRVVIPKGHAKMLGRVVNTGGQAGSVFIATEKISLAKGPDGPCYAAAIWPEDKEAGVKGVVVEPSIFNRVFFGANTQLRLLKGTPVLLKLEKPLALPAPVEEPNDGVAVVATRDLHEVNSDLLLLIKKGTVVRPFSRIKAVNELVRYWAPESSVEDDGKILVNATDEKHRIISRRLAALEKASFDDASGLFAVAAH